jgi:ATP-dependent RNA circularization protein (DNA/RNA ligase family)
MKIVCYTFVKNVTSTQQNAIDMAYSILFETKLTFHTSKIIRSTFRLDCLSYFKL